MDLSAIGLLLDAGLSRNLVLRCLPTFSRIAAGACSQSAAEPAIRLMLKLLRGIRILVNMRACGDMYICDTRRGISSYPSSNESKSPGRWSCFLVGMRLSFGLVGASPCLRSSLSGGVGGLSAREVS